MLEGRLLYDVTKASKQKQKSGLIRVSNCLKREFLPLLENRFVEVVWDERKEAFIPLSKDRSFRVEPEDVFLTGELFCEFERPGIESFLKEAPCRTYAIFHDAIPLQHPEFTWPHSVQRHPSYMKMLTLFSGVFAVSGHSSILLEEYWEWLGIEDSPSVKSIQLGADGVFSDPSPPKSLNEGRLQLMVLSILETRKGQDLALEASKRLWEEGLEFDLHFVGRTNPYFGKEIDRLLRNAAREGYAVHCHGPLDDHALQERFLHTDLVLLPSLAEGCGLPVLESLWKGVPTLSSSLHSVRETARFGGCQLFEKGSSDALADSLRSLLTERSRLEALTSEIRTDMLPRWEGTVHEIIDHIYGDGRLLEIVESAL